MKIFTNEEKYNMLHEMVRTMMEYDGDLQIPECEDDKEKIKWMESNRKSARWVYDSVEEIIKEQVEE
jgi:hypothetical protein